MGQTYAAIDQSAQTGTVVLGHLDDRTDTLQSSFSGTGNPGSPVEGQLCRRTDTEAMTYYDGASWVPFAGLGEEWVADAEVSFQQLKEARVENLGADEAVAAGKDGHLFYHTGSGDLKMVDEAVDSAVKVMRNVIIGTTTQTLDLPQPLLDASNPPTAGTKGTTPTHRGWLFAAANELASWSIRVPSDYRNSGNLTLRLWCVLNQAETNADDIDWSADLTSLISGESTTGTSTAAAASTTDIGTDSADGDLHTCDIVIDYDDADNPVNAGDLLTIEIHRTDLAEVGGVILEHAALIYQTSGGVL